MRNVFYDIGVAAVGAVALWGVGLAQDGLLGRFSPFVINVEQAVPVTVAVPVEIDGGDMLTATVPMTVSVALQVRVDGPGAAVVVEDAPTPAVTVAASEGAEVDDLGYPYEILASEHAVAIEEWEVFIDSRGDFAVTGKVVNESEGEQFSLVEIAVRFYRADGTLLDVGSVSASSRWLKPGESSRFDSSLYVDPDQVDHYEVTVDSVDWRPVG